MARKLVLYDDYTREEVHDVFDPDSTFAPQAGSWGLWGIVEIPGRPRDYLFLVTFGQKQAGHEFDEGISAEGVLRWQSQPKQRLKDRTIQTLVAHDEDVNSIYLFLRTAEKRRGSIIPYTYLGRLKYLAHDKDREQPVYFAWQILEWPMPDSVQRRIQVNLEQTTSTPQPSAARMRDQGLVYVPPPEGGG
jgi:hypothetical protein